MPSYDFGTQSVPSFPVSSSISRARVPQPIQTKYYPAARARSPLPSSSGHVQRPSTADSTTGAFPALGKDSHLRAFDAARSRSPSPSPQPTTSSHLLENGLRKLRSIGRSKDKDKDKERDRERERDRDRSYRYAEPFNPTASAPAMALSFGTRSRTPPHTVTSFTAIRPSTPPSSSNLRAPPHTAAAGSSFRPQHGPSSSLAMPPGARSADPFSASFTDAVRTDPFAARDHLARTRRNSLRESGAPQPRSGPAPTKITTSSSHGGSRRPDKGKAPAYVPSNASTASLSDAAPPPARPPPVQEPRLVQQQQHQQVTPPKQQQQQATPPKQAKSGHQKSASSGVFAGFAASGMGMGLPPTAAFTAPRVKPRTNRSVTDTSIPSSHARSASQQAPDATFVYGLGGGSGFHFSVARTSSREGTARSKDHAPKPLPPVPGSAPASAVEPAPQPVVEISHAAVALSPKGKTPLTPAFVGMTASPSFKTNALPLQSPSFKPNALPRQDDSMLSPMTAGGPTSAGTPLSGASALSVWEDSPLGPPPSLVDPLSPGATKPEPVRPAVRSRWAPRSDAGSDDELRSALESVLSPDTGAAQPAKSKTAAVRPKARRRASSLDSHYRLATPARTRFYDPPAMFTPPATSSFVSPDTDAAPEPPRSAKSRSFIIASPRDNEARDFVNAMLRGDVQLDPALMGPRESKVPPWAHHNRGLSIDTNLGIGVGRPPSRPPRAAPVKVEAPPPAAAPATVAPPILDLEAPPEPQQQEKKARPKTRTVTTLWTELWQDVHSAQFASPASPDVPPLPTSLATAPTHAHTHALPAARSSTLGSAPPNQARNSTLSTLSSMPSLSAFPMPPSPPPAVPPLPAATVLAAKHQHHPRAKLGPGGGLSSPALPSLNFGSPLSVSFGDSPRSLFSAASGPHDFLSPARSSSSGLASSMFASSPASLRSVGSGAADMLAAPSEHHGLKRAAE